MIGQMMFVPLLALAYLACLFAIAAFGDRAARHGRRLGGPWIYTLSLGVYCTTASYYGGVGIAMEEGLAFLPIFLGPMVAMFLSPLILYKILRIARAYNITSIADFLAARYGKRSKLGIVVSCIALIGVAPAIAVQLKSVAASINLLSRGSVHGEGASLANDTALYVALGLAAFTILFGTRQVDATERHQGMVLAVAFESVVKLVVLLALGGYVVFGLYAGPADLAGRVEAAGLDRLLTFDGTGMSGTDWLLMILAAGLGFMFLPRQFQVAVIENQDPGHLTRASWALPAYFLLFLMFIMPMALAGILHQVPVPDLAILQLPLDHGAYALVVAVFLGGLSAAAAMVVVETIALATMVSNDLVLPLLLRTGWLSVAASADPSRLLLLIRRVAIVLIVLAGYLFFRLVGAQLTFVEFGMFSLVAAAQFGPPILIGMYWRDANWIGALTGLCLSFAVWCYTLLLPAFVMAEFGGEEVLTHGPFGIELLSPHSLLGFEGLSPTGHAIFWTLLLNLLGLVLGSLLGHSTGLDRTQAEMFVDVWSRADATRMWRGEVRIRELRDMLQRFVGPERTAELFAADARRLGVRLPLDGRADARLVQTAERQLARAVGSASARALIGSMVKSESIGTRSVMEILDETSQLIRYSRELERKSSELERATQELREANRRLREVDRLKDDFMATVSHELRTPLTSIRAFSEIVRDNPDLTDEERENFLGVVTRETERLTRLINDILDLSKIESGRMQWRTAAVPLGGVVREAVDSVMPLLDERKISLTLDLGRADLAVQAERDRLEQVLINLISNACKFVAVGKGRIQVVTKEVIDQVELRVEDDGPGVPPAEREAIFGKFIQLGDRLTAKPEGTGLGLSISRQIVEAFGGTLRVEASRLGGAAFVATLKIAKSPVDAADAAE
ncbi:MAG TPA: sensor histidine kinase [Geminicoccus sp.]|uniref:sensor histidine kinase n=1 Tax=Geminicoccus sp. TaxID=2024832 RepID=UPI002BFA1245|nr:sensor histidine kinase [Geminicoccus sp.]HWL67773.1 sensor histidine kinase [Geminicoccus sp.]